MRVIRHRRQTRPHDRVALLHFIFFDVFFVLPLLLFTKMDIVQINTI